MQFTPELLLGLILGLVFGSLLTTVWFILRRSRQITSENAEKTLLNSELTLKTSQVTDLQNRLALSEQRYEHVLLSNDTLSNDLATLHERVKNYEHQIQQLELIDQRFSASFDSLASKALNASTEQFLALAQQSFSVLREGAQADLQQKETAITTLIEPISAALTKVDSKLAELESARASTTSMLQENLRSLLEAHSALRNETATLSQALRSPNARGSWGEMQLRRVIEFSGMLEYCDFETQAHRTDQETNGSVRPDVVVQLPNNRCIVIDAKTPLSAYLEAQSCSDPAIKKDLLRQHAVQLKAQVRSLATKKYWNQFKESPEFVVLFIPGEVFFSAALEQDPSLLEDSFQERVILATPTTLIALLKAVAYGWRTEKMTQNALEIRDLAKSLIDRVASVRDSFEQLGSMLGKSSEAYNKTLRLLDEKVLVTAQKISALGVTTSATDEKSLAAPSALTVSPKESSTAEFQ